MRKNPVQTCANICFGMARHVFFLWRKGTPYQRYTERMTTSPDKVRVKSTHAKKRESRRSFAIVFNVSAGSKIKPAVAFQ